jgi:hypothetical protein
MFTGLERRELVDGCILLASLENSSFGTSVYDCTMTPTLYMTQSL